jgi:hypothetical protein
LPLRGADLVPFPYVDAHWAACPAVADARQHKEDSFSKKLINSIGARIVAAKIRKVFEPVSVRGSGNEGKQAGKIGSDFQRAECTKFSHKKVRSKGALEQSDGQELDQESLRHGLRG